MYLLAHNVNRMYFDIWCLSADQIDEKTSKKVEITKNKENVKKIGFFKSVELLFWVSKTVR